MSIIVFLLTASYAFRTPQVGRLPRKLGTSAVDSLYTPPTPALPGIKEKVAGAASLGLLDESARLALGSGVPHSLVAGALLVLALVGLGDRGQKAHAQWLAPGSALILAWMPAFFVPALVALPLTNPVVSTARDAAALAGVIVVGLFATLASTSAASAAFKDDVPAEVVKTAPGAKLPIVPLALATLVSAACAAATPVSAGVFLSFATLATFALSTRLKSKLLHPVVTCAGLTTLVVRLYGAVKNLDPLVATAFYCATAGAWLQRLLGPAVLALACGIYARRAEVVASWRQLSAGVGTGVLTGMYGTAALVNALGLPPEAKKALIPRCVTTPLALPICDSLGANAGAAVASVVATGVLGAALGPAFLSRLHKGDDDKPKARGLAMGAAAHGIGTAQLANDPAAQPYASMALSLCGALSVVLAAAPPTRSLLFWMAGL